MLAVVDGMLALCDDETGEVLVRPYFKTPTNHDTLAEAKRTSLVCKDESLTDQSQVEDADINVLVKRIEAGTMVPLDIGQNFGDADEVEDYLAMANRLAEHKKLFYNLTPGVREEYQNDYTRWATQVMRDLTTGNLQHIQEMGIDVNILEAAIVKKEPEKVVEPPVPPT